MFNQIHVEDAIPILVHPGQDRQLGTAAEPVGGGSRTAAE